MIISASRRTDIPAFYSEWFLNRIKAGFVDVRNPMNHRQISRIPLNTDVVDCIVFWSKNPLPLLSKLNQLSGYKYYFQFTINPYDISIENNVSKKTSIISTFKKLSDLIGPDRVVWRYDPILMTEKIDTLYHLKYYEEIASRLENYTHRCVISFVDLYKKTASNTKAFGVREPSCGEMRIIAQRIAQIAESNNITIQSCSEKIDLSDIRIMHGHCIDKSLIESIIGYPIDVKKDPNQRNECGCIQSIDIGAYNTCTHGCKYCYANFNDKMVTSQVQRHCPNSSLLIGEISPEDKVTEKKVSSLRSNSIFTFD